MKAFTEFYKNKIDANADTFFIDPNTNNPRAFHVYEQAGFEMVGYYYAKQGFFREEKSCLMVKNSEKSWFYLIEDGLKGTVAS